VRFGQTGDGLVVEPQVEDGVEHARHGLAGARADRDEQRVGGIAQPAAGLLLQAAERLRDLLVEAVRDAPVHPACRPRKRPS
jgi:hypothetical protein